MLDIGKTFSFSLEVHSAKLHGAMSELAKRLANTIVEWPDIKALMCSHKVALDKCPGVQPIAIRAWQLAITSWIYAKWMSYVLDLGKALWEQSMQ